MEKRMGIFLSLVVFLLGGLVLRVAYIGVSPKTAEASALQSQKVMSLSKTRAGIFDRNGEALVNRDSERRVLVFPDMLDTSDILEFTDRDSLAAAFQKFGPTVLNLEGKIIEGEGIYNFSYPKRYSKSQIAPHIIGYINGGKGVFGIEKSYNGFLEENGSEISVRYITDGRGKLLLGEEISLLSTEISEKSGVVLTLDKEIQLAAEKAILSTEKGAAVVLDVNTGEILAAASSPSFDPGDIEASLNDENAPFINRAFTPYSVGSTWKLVVAAAALEKGISQNREFECKGQIEVDGRVYKCHWTLGHGKIDMNRALEISCNPYFIDLALEIGGEAVLDMAKNIGFGAGTSFGEGFSSQGGKLPNAESLKAKTVLSSFAFGQGELLATPLQLACLASAIANGGNAVTPKLVLGTYDKEGTYFEEPSYAKNRVMSEKTAEILRGMMINVVEKGSGENAKPKNGGAGGKTASAQTGQYGENGEEIIHAWFLGFYPAENPQYAIVVLAEGMNSGGDFAAPIFKEICEGILKAYP